MHIMELAALPKLEEFTMNAAVPLYRSTQLLEDEISPTAAMLNRNPRRLHRQTSRSLGSKILSYR